MGQRFITRRRTIRAGVASAAALALVATSSMTAQAAVSEWWFGAWQIPKVWQTTKGAGVTVAVLDSGVNASLPELSGAILSGGDVTGGGTDGRTDVDPVDRGHGTSMTALIAGNGRGSGMQGVAPEAKILPVLVHDDNKNQLGVVNYPAGIRFAADHGAKIISISQASDGVGYPGGCPNEVRDAVRYAANHDAIVVAAAGNEGDKLNAQDFPAACPGVVAVGALASNRQPWISTQRQSYVDVGAPGVDITSVDKNGQLVTASGTSPAAALVSGALALVRSAHPDLNGRQAVARLLATVSDAGPAGKDNTSGVGAVRAFQAVTENVPKDAPNYIYDELDKVSPPSKTSNPTPPANSDKPSAGNSNSNSAADSDKDSGTNPVLVALMVIAATVVVLSIIYSVVKRGRRKPPSGGSGTITSYPNSPQSPPPPQQWSGQSSPWQSGQPGSQGNQPWTPPPTNPVGPGGYPPAPPEN